MISDKLLKLAPYAAALVIAIIYIPLFYSRYNDQMYNIANLELQRTRVNNKIKQLNKTNRDTLELETDVFFNEQKFFEQYIREHFAHNKARIRYYRIQIEKKDRGIISVEFDIPVQNFFVLLRELEEGKKLIIINSIGVRKRDAPLLRVSLKLEGYYK